MGVVAPGEKKINKHNTARVAACWFIMYYRLVMHGNSNIYKKTIFLSLQLIRYSDLLLSHCNNERQTASQYYVTRTPPVLSRIILL